MRDIVRFLIILEAGAACLLCLIVVRNAQIMFRHGAKRLCVPRRTMMINLAALILSGLGATTQLLIWITKDVPFAVYRAPLVFVVVTAQLITGILFINHMYSTRE